MGITRMLRNPLFAGRCPFRKGKSKGIVLCAQNAQCAIKDHSCAGGTICGRRTNLLIVRLTLN